MILAGNISMHQRFFPKMNASNMQLIDKTMKLDGKTYNN